MSAIPSVVITTDGSCYPNPNGNGGWAALVEVAGKEPVELSGAVRFVPPVSFTSNNTMELTAILQGLRSLPLDIQKVLIRSDSQYAINSLTVWHKGWARRGWTTATGEPVKNRELIEEVLAEMAKHGEVTFTWTKGHANDVANNRCDELAMKARQALNHV